MFVAKGKEQFLKEIKKRFPMDVQKNILSGFLAQRLNVASSEAKMKASIIDEDIV